MTVYAEILFAENFILGYIILLLTGRLRGCCRSKWRIAAGSVMCGIYAFILFVPLHWVIAVITKLLFSVLVVVTVFGMINIRELIKTAGVFYIVSLLMGGVTIAIMYMLEFPFMTANGSFVMKGMNFIQLSAGVIVTWFLVSWLAKMLNEKMTKEKVIRDVEIQIGNVTWRMKALLDTGNSLKEPVTGRPVMVMAKTAGEKMCKELGPEMNSRMCMIPYKTISKTGVMVGVRTDRLMVGNRNIERSVLGIGENDFDLWQGCEKYDLLLNQQLLEGEE